MILQKTSVRRSLFCSGLINAPIAPIRKPRSRSSSPVIRCTGMWRLWTSSFNLANTVQPFMSGRLISSVMALGLRSWTRASASAPRASITPLKPCSRAVSRRIGLKRASFSTINTTRSPGWIWSRSSLNFIGGSGSDSVAMADNSPPGGFESAGGSIRAAACIRSRLAGT